MQPVETLEKDRQAIVKTIAKIESTRPALGAKWKEGMLTYWYIVLAELTLATTGAEYGADDVHELARKLRSEAG